MLPERTAGGEPSRETINYDQQLRDMAVEEGVPEGVISDRGFALTANLLKKVRHDHGNPTSDTYKYRHNDQHGLDFIRYFWALWKPLSEEMPEVFDQDGFELGMIIGAGHDLIYDKRDTKERPGHNERESARITCRLMLEAGYEGSRVQRVHNGIIKTTVKHENGLIIQPQMRRGSDDILGLCAGQADMNGALIKGPSELVRTAYMVWLEENQDSRQGNSIKNILSRSASFAKFLRNQKHYYVNRVAVLSDDLKHYVDDEQQRSQIVAIYRAQFGSASLRTLKAVNRLHDTPEKTLQMVEDSFNYAGRIAHRGVGGILTVPQYLAKRLGFDRADSE